MKKIVSFLLIMVFTWGSAPLNLLYAEGNVPVFEVSLGDSIRIDLQYLYGPNPKNIHVFHEHRAFDFYASGPETWIFNVKQEYEGVVILSDGETIFTFIIEIKRSNAYAMELSRKIVCSPSMDMILIRQDS